MLAFTSAGFKANVFIKKDEGWKPLELIMQGGLMCPGEISVPDTKGTIQVMVW